MGKRILRFGKALFCAGIVFATALVLGCGGGTVANPGPVTPTLVGPVFITQPVSQAVVVGANVTFSVAASGTPTPTFQWERSSDGFTWTPTNVTSTNFSINSVQLTDNGARFRANASNGVGSPAISSVATLTVTGNSTTTTLTNGQVLTGEVVGEKQFRMYSLSVPTGATSLEVRLNNPTGDPDLYVRRGSAPTESVFDGHSANSNSAEIVQISQPASGTWYFGVFGYGTGVSGYSITASYLNGGTGQTAPLITTQPQSQTVTVGSTATFTAAASGNPAPSFQWERSTDGVSWVTVSSATSATYSFLAQSTDTGAKFRVKASNGIGTPATSNIATLTVNPSTVVLLSGQTLSGEIVGPRLWRLYSIQVPSGATSLDVRLANPTGDPDLYVRQGLAPTTTQYDGYSAGSAAETVLISQPASGLWYVGVFGYPAADSSIYDVTATIASPGSDTAPVFTTQPQSQTGQSGSTITFTAAASGNPTPTLQWERSTNGTSWTSVGSGTSYSLTAQPVDNGAKFRAVATNRVNSVNSAIATLTVSSSGPITMRYQLCSAPSQPLLVAYQEDDGDWTRLAGSNGVYTFTLANENSRYGLLVVYNNGVNQSVSIRHALAKEPFVDCFTANSVSVIGRVIGLGSNEEAELALTGAMSVVVKSSTGGSFSTYAAEGLGDFMGAKYAGSTATMPTRLFIRRGVTLSAPGPVTLGDVDFSTEGFAAGNTDELEVTGSDPDEQVSTSVTYVTENQARLVLHRDPYVPSPGGGSLYRSFASVPAANQVAADRYVFQASAYVNLGPGFGMSRMVYKSTPNSASPTLPLPTVVDANFTVASTNPYVRNKATWSVADYNNFAFLFGQGPKRWMITLSPGWIQGSSGSYVVPDFSAISGWNNAWGLATGIQINWQATGVKTSETSGTIEMTQSAIWDQLTP